MSPIPNNDVTMADVVEWYRLQGELAKIKAAEALLRGKIFKHFFPNPTEGTNSYEMNDGTGAVMKGGYVINRTVDVGALDALRKMVADEQLNPDNKMPTLKLDQLVKWKPEVAISEYRKLTEEERLRFDQCLVIKPGAPSLEIMHPKRAKPAS